MYKNAISTEATTGRTLSCYIPHPKETDRNAELNRAVARFRGRKTKVLDVLVTKKDKLNFVAKKLALIYLLAQTKTIKTLCHQSIRYANMP